MRVVRTAFRDECEQLVGVMRGLAEVDFDRSTNCPPWTIRELFAHVRTGASRLVDMLAAPAPSRAGVDAAGYYGAAKFTPAVDTARVDSARREADELPSGYALVTDFDRSWRAADDAIAAQPPGRVVRTRHGDAMDLNDFLLTRVVELGVHGLDLALALAREPWLTPSAADVIAGLLVGGRGVPDELGWDRLTLVAKATGRLPLTGREQVVIEGHGFRWLSFSG